MSEEVRKELEAIKARLDKLEAGPKVRRLFSEGMSYQTKKVSKEPGDRDKC